ncbi:MAG: hypothetical protein AB8G26_17305, partial [Ilumatobacter sp.]
MLELAVLELAVLALAPLTLRQHTPSQQPPSRRLPLRLRLIRPWLPSGLGSSDSALPTLDVRTD